jgi:sugar lactone lactonase YvrE
MTGTLLDARPRLLAEFGPVGGFGSPPPLGFPTAAELTHHGTCLVVDRAQPVNRLLEVDPQGSIVWQHESPPRMNGAHRLDPFRVLVAIGPSLYLVDRDHRREHLITLPGVESFDCMDVRENIAALGSDAGLDLVRLDGTHLKRIPIGVFRNPTGVHLLDDLRAVVADSWQSQVVEIDANGVLLRAFGRRRSAGNGPDCMSGPRSVCRTRDGHTIVADTLAHRLIDFDPAGAARVIAVDLFAPSHVRETPTGSLLVADTGNHRMLTIGRDGFVQWVFGPSHAPERHLSFPRAAVPTARGGVLVCDSFHHRVVELDERNSPIWSFDDGLVIPRSAVRDRLGRTIIADGVNGRVLAVSSDGRIEREITSVRHGAGWIALDDPHSVVPAGRDSLLITDSDLGAVLLVDGEDRVTRLWGGPGSDLLADPHHAAFDLQGGVLVADSGHQRVLRLTPDGSVVAQAKPDLRYPRHVHPLPNGAILIADTDNARIVQLDEHGQVVRTAGPLIDTADRPGSPTEIRTPRGVALDAAGHLVVTDFWNSRVVVLDE